MPATGHGSVYRQYLALEMEMCTAPHSQSQLAGFLHKLLIDDAWQGLFSNGAYFPTITLNVQF